MARVEDVATRTLDVLESGLLVLSPDLDTVIHKNAAVAKLFPTGIPADVWTAIRGYAASRRATGKLPPAIRMPVGERAFFIRVVPMEGQPELEVAFVREEVARDADMYRVLNERLGLSRREYEVVAAMRMGKTNREIGEALGLAEGTVARHVHRLLAKCRAPNRTRLVEVVQQLLARRA